MTQSVDESQEACSDLADPMGQLLGGAVAVPAFAAAAAPFVETGPGAVIVGASAAYGAYDTVRDIVADNWDNTVCEPLAAVSAPEPADAQPDWSATDPFSADQSPFQSSFDEIMAPPEAQVTIFDSTPSGDFSTGGYSPGDSFGGPTSDGGGYSGGGGSSSDGGGSAD